jgi:plastocyanin
MRVARLGRRIGVGGLVIIAAACSGSASTGVMAGPPPPPPPPGTVDVTIKDFSFVPAAVTIKVGQTVRWTNTGPSAHTSTSDTGVWDSKTIAAPGNGYGGNGTSEGGTFQVTFMQPGTFGYHCTIHPPSMYPSFVGTVTVTQ